MMIDLVIIWLFCQIIPNSWKLHWLLITILSVFIAEKDDLFQQISLLQVLQIGQNFKVGVWYQFPKRYIYAVLP